MAGKYATSAWALGLCDRCGFSYPLRELHREIYDLRPNGLKVCSTCLDKDSPQLQIGRVNSNDPQSLRDPRPDVDRLASTSFVGWNPVGHPLIYVQTEVGTVTVTTV
jgi:hypothetical protein